MEPGSAPEPTKAPAPFSREWAHEIVQYHQPDALGIEHISAIRAATENLILAICANCPPSADRSAAVRLAREAMMTANASIVLRGIG